MSQNEQSGHTAGHTIDESTVIPQVIPDESTGPTTSHTDGMTDTPEVVIPPVIPQVVPPVIPQVIPPVIPELPQENGLVQKSLKLSAWLGRELDLEAGSNGDSFNAHVVKILLNRSRVAEEYETLNNRYIDLKRFYTAEVAKNADLQAKNEALLLESQKQITAKQAIEPQIEVLAKVLDAIIEDAVFYSTIRKEFLIERREHWLNYFLTNPS